MKKQENQNKAKKPKQENKHPKKNWKKMIFQ